MIIFKDNSGYQTYPNESEVDHFKVSEQTANEIKGGKKWKLSETKDSVVFLSESEILIEQEKEVDANIDIARSLEYPSISEQLDMIYWDQVNNTSIWRNKITEVKTKHPKRV